MAKTKSASSQAYAEKLKDPRWQKMRLKILERDEFTCRKCCDFESTLVVHHRYYIWGREPWEYPPEILVTLCQECHENEHEDQDQASDLIKVLKCGGFFNSDISDLCAAFHGLQVNYPPEVFCSALVRMMSDSGRTEAFMKNYFAEIHEENLKKKANG